MCIYMSMYQCIIYIYNLYACDQKLYIHIHIMYIQVRTYLHAAWDGQVVCFLCDWHSFFFEKLGGNVRKAVVCLERVEFNVINRDMKWEYL